MANKTLAIIISWLFLLISLLCFGLGISLHNKSSIILIFISGIINGYFWDYEKLWRTCVQGEGGKRWTSKS